MDKVEYLVGSKKIHNYTIYPYSKIICDFLADFSIKLQFAKEINQFPDLKSLAFWIRKKNILLLKKNFFSSVPRLAVGLVFHISPSNIPTNFAYSLIFGILTGNSNIIKVPSKNFPQINIICDVLKEILNKKKYKLLSKMIKVVRYDKNSEFTKEISKICDARLIWGGDKTISEIKKFQTNERNRDLTFPDRFSFSIINTGKFDKLGVKEQDVLAKNFYNDTYLVDQNACSSPHLIIWYGKSFKKTRAKFWKNLKKVVKDKYELSENSVMEKYTKFCSDLISIKNIKFVDKSDNSVQMIFLNKIDKNIHLNRGKWGLFYEYNLQNISELKKYINKKHQTITYFGFEKKFFENFLFNNNIQGIDRIVPIGRSLDMSLLWDGYEINNFLTRTIELR